MNESVKISWSMVGEQLQQDWRSLGHRERQEFSRLRHILPWLADPEIGSDSDFVDDVQWPRPTSMIEESIGLAAIPVVMNQLRQLSSASDAAVLPLRWTIRSQHHTGVPDPIVQVAEQIRERFRDDPDTASRMGEQSLNEFHLEWSAEGWGNVDFHDVVISAESAAAGLMIGLASAIERVPVKATFIASGALSDQSSDGSRTQTWKAEGIQRKCRHALAIGFERFALPADAITRFDQTAESEKQKSPSDSSDDISLLRLPLESIKPETGVWQSLASLRVLAGSPPDLDSSIDERVAWYHSLASSNTVETYYADYLLGDVADCLRKRIASFGTISPIGSVCGVYSHAVGLLPLFVAVHRPQKLLVLIGQDVPQAKRDQFDKQVRNVSKEIEIDFHDVSSDDPIGSIENVVINMDRTQPVVLEALSGYRDWSLGMVLAAQPGDLIVNWRSETKAHSRRAEPFSLMPTVWQADAQGHLQRIKPDRPVANA